MRTGACSALSVRLLARETFGAGRAWDWCTGSIARARGRTCATDREVRIAGRDPAKAESLAVELAQELDLPVRAAPSYREALEHADIVCATTHTLQPVVHRRSPPSARETGIGRKLTL